MSLLFRPNTFGFVKCGYVVGVTRDSVVTAFSRMKPLGFKSYIRGEIVPLIGRLAEDSSRRGGPGLL
jgi:hypothetical protein